MKIPNTCHTLIISPHLSSQCQNRMYIIVFADADKDFSTGEVQELAGEGGIRLPANSELLASGTNPGTVFKFIHRLLLTLSGYITIVSL